MKKMILKLIVLVALLASFNGYSAELTAPTIIAPVNKTSDAPEYRWTTVKGASWYQLYINDSTGNRTRKWYKSAQVNCKKSCSISLNITLTKGRGKFWVRTWNAKNGAGPWSTSSAFNVTTGSLEAVVLDKPTGVITHNLPTYTWHPATGASWYQLYVNDSTGNRISQWYTSAQADCSKKVKGINLCSVTPDIALSKGSGKWWVQTWGSGEYGFGLWSLPNTFNIRKPSIPVSLEYDFNDGDLGWITGFSDYPVGEEKRFELKSGWRKLPMPSISTVHGLYLSGNNRSDNLLMFIKKRIDGLQANTRYSIHYKVELASIEATGCLGAGGAPGEGVSIKAGASPIEPVPQVVASGNPKGFYRLNIDHGTQSNPGSDAIVIGDLATPKTDCNDKEYEIKRLNNRNIPFNQYTDSDGKLWLFLASDSGYEGITKFYFTKASVTLDLLP